MDNFNGASDDQMERACLVCVTSGIQIPSWLNVTVLFANNSLLLQHQQSACLYYLGAMLKQNKRSSSFTSEKYLSNNKNFGGFGFF